VRASLITLATCLIFGLIGAVLQYLIYLLARPAISYQTLLAIQFASFWVLEANSNYKNKQKLNSYIAAYG